MSRFPLLITAVALAAALLGCTPEPPIVAGPTADEDTLEAEATTQPEDLVDLTIYYRHGSGPAAYLTPVIREIPVDRDLPRRALQLLLDGPRARDGKRVRAPLPVTTTINDFDVRGGTAHVDLSRDVVRDAGTVGNRYEHEALGIAALANTLTEFPAVDRVRVTIGGRYQRSFWGHWGMPRVLVRDETVIEPQMRGPRVPTLDGFVRKAQRVGVRQRKAPAVSVVRVQSMTTFLRLTVEVTAARGGKLKGPVPPSRARRKGDRVVLAIEGRPRRAVLGDLGRKLGDPAFRGARVDLQTKPRAVVVTLRPKRRSGFWLHTLPEPARIVLDIRR